MEPTDTPAVAAVAAVDAGSGRLAGLDGLRGLAVLLVVAFHANLPVVRYGGMAGVSLFFVLSGYLITTLLVTERAQTGTIALGSFYARRALRLLPALWFAVLGGVAICAITGIAANQYGWQSLAALFYVGNLTAPLHIDGGPFIHLWTLGMEEQFYLVWPVLLLLCFRRSRSTALVVASVLAVVSLVWRLAGPISTRKGYNYAYYLPQTNVFAPLFGAALALWLADRARPVRVPTWLTRAALVAFLLAATVGGMKDGLHEGTDPLSFALKVIVGPVTAVLSIAIVLAVVTRSWGPRWLTHPLLLFFGQISYALYLWHEILDWIFGIGLNGGREGLRGLAIGSATAVAGVGMAVFSRRFVEAPFLRRKVRFERTHLDPPTPTVATT